MIKVFHDSKYGSIRTSYSNNEAALCLKDLCHLLHIKNIPECRGKLDEKYVRQIEVEEKGSKKKVLFILEENLSGCLFQSPNPEAEQICNWLYLKVLPKLKMYIDYQIKNFQNPDVMVQFLDQYEDLKIKSNVLETTLKMQSSKTKMVDALMETKNCYDLSNVHEMLKFRGIRNTQLLKILRSYNILDKENMPRTEYIDKRYFRVVEAKASHEAKTITVKRVYVYQTGINFIEKLMRQYEGERYAKTK